MLARTLLARRGEHAALQRHHLLLHAEHFELKLLRCTLPAQRRILLRERFKPRVQPLILRERECCHLFGDVEVGDVRNAQRHTA